MAAFFKYSCLWSRCGKNCASLVDLIDHIEAVHIERDPRILEKQEASQPSAVPLSYVNCFFSEATRTAHRKIKESDDDNMDFDYTPIKKKKSITQYSLNLPTPDVSDNGDDDGNFSDNSDDSWTTTSDGITSELILNSVTVDDGDTKRYICPVKGCGKRYKNANGIKYHAKNGHIKDGKMKKPHKCHCGKSYKSQSGLRHHTATRHSALNANNLTETGGGIELLV